jgi:type II secretory pathway pseudopilin PulG
VVVVVVVVVVVLLLLLLLLLPAAAAATTATTAATAAAAAAAAAAAKFESAIRLHISRRPTPWGGWGCGMSAGFQKPSSIAGRTLAVPPRQFEGQSETLIYFQRVPVSCLRLLLTAGLLCLCGRVPIDISGSGCDSVSARGASVVVCGRLRPGPLRRGYRQRLGRLVR